MEIIKAKTNLLKQTQEKEEQKYQAFKKQVDEFEARSTKLQWDNNNLEHVVKEQDVEILNLKQKIQIDVHLKNETILVKEYIWATYN